MVVIVVVVVVIVVLPVVFAGFSFSSTCVQPVAKGIKVEEAEAVFFVVFGGAPSPSDQLVGMAEASGQTVSTYNSFWNSPKTSTYAMHLPSIDENQGWLGVPKPRQSGPPAGVVVFSMCEAFSPMPNPMLSC